MENYAIATDLLKFGLWVVEMRALNDLRELSVQTDTKVEHSSVNLHFGRRWVTSQSRVMYYYHTLPEANTCIIMLNVTRITITVLSDVVLYM